MMRKLLFLLGVILSFQGLLFLCGALFLGFYLVDELRGPRPDNEGLYILGTWVAITLVGGVAGILGGARLLGLRWLGNLSPLSYVILSLTGAVLLGVPGLIILRPPGPMSDMDAALAWGLVIGSAALAVIPLIYRAARMRRR